MLTEIEFREVFHFSFLERLLKISDPALYVLKGGVNLRFFFKSPRYSEDMDLDVLGGNVATLKKNGFKILADGAFRRSLRVYGIEDLDVNDPEKAKQTGTTQRFRVGLITAAGVRLPTKVEFSRRLDSDLSPALDLVDPEIARHYRRLSFRCQHYSGETASIQKARALIGRAVTQARDVFDLAILYQGGYASKALLHQHLDQGQRQQAMDCLTGLSWEDYAGQVVEFFGSEDRKQYGSPQTWEQMQETLFALFDDHA